MCVHEAMLKYMQLAGSDLVKSVLQLLIDGNKHNKYVKWEKKFILVLKAWDHGQVFMKAVARNIYLWELTQFQMVKWYVSNNLNTSYVKKDRKLHKMTYSYKALSK